jgi:hypothetical protein
MGDAEANLMVAGMIVIVPAVLARLVAIGWLQVACAFALWFIALFLVLGGELTDAVFGFTLIVSMFFAWAGVPLAAAVLRVFNVPYRFLRAKT